MDSTMRLLRVCSLLLIQACSGQLAAPTERTAANVVGPVTDAMDAAADGTTEGPSGPSGPSGISGPAGASGAPVLRMAPGVATLSVSESSSFTCLVDDLPASCTWSVS